MLLSEIKALFFKDLLLEWRNRYALNGALLYVGGTVFVCYLSFNVRRGLLNAVTWNALFWIILLFVAINAAAKSFMGERRERYLYYYTLASPQAAILSKIIYNFCLLLVMALLAYAVYSLVMGNPVQDHLLFLLNLALGSWAFASCLSLISAIAAKTTSGSMLMAVLGFPVLLPALVMLIRVSKNAMDGLERSNSYDELLVLAATNAISMAASYLLFPYLWRS